MEQGRALARSWYDRAHAAQLEPEGDWRTWLFMGGRGAGKTRAGAEWLRAQARRPGARLALVGPTLHDVREVMVGGASGLLSVCPPSERPVWEATRRRLYWPATDASAQAFSAEDADSLRGPQFHAAWADEFCAWRRPETLAMLRFGLRLGRDPRLVVTTTPRPTAALKALRAEAGTQETNAATSANAAHLAPGFEAGLRAVYGGTRLAAQEIDGLVVEALEGALWSASMLSGCRGPAASSEQGGAFDRVVVGLDPPASATGDACGIVVAGRCGETAWVLEDATVRGLSPLGWARAAVGAAERWKAGLIVAEANQGGDMVRHTLNQAEPPCGVRLVHATRGKRARAEPVAALYERGRVRHAGTFGPLEEELLALGADGGPGRSPDRADALVWALTALMLEPRAGPRAGVAWSDRASLIVNPFGDTLASPSGEAVVINTGSEPIAIVVTLEARGDGGVRASSRNLRGLHLSGADPERVWGMIPEAIATLLRANHGVRVASVRASKSPDDAFAGLPTDVLMLAERERIFVVEVEAMAA